jgi:ADP-ribose pyrophosphatase YjhB (NUDIX family)
MKDDKSTKWLDWAREIQSLCQTGLAFSKTNYETVRFNRLIEIAAEIVSVHSNLDKLELSKQFVEHPGYATPKIDVRAAVINDGKILLVQEISDDKWAMPGGWADVGDYPSEVVIRETKEESGFDVLPLKIIGVFDANRSGRPIEFFHAFKIIFLCELVGGEAKISDETKDVRFFDFDNLPEFSPNRTNMIHINEILEHLKNNDRPAAFD